MAVRGNDRRYLCSNYLCGDTIMCSVDRYRFDPVNDISQSAGRDYFSEKVALFCINKEASRAVKIWRGITTFILHFNWF